MSNQRRITSEDVDSAIVALRRFERALRPVRARAASEAAQRSNLLQLHLTRFSVRGPSVGEAAFICAELAVIWDLLKGLPLSGVAASLVELLNVATILGCAALVNAIS